MLSADYLLSPEWYGRLADLLSAEDAALAGKLFDLMSSVLTSDELMLLHFKKGSRPDVVEHRTQDVRRKKQLSEYRAGFYLLDPFYLSLERGSRLGVLSLRDVVEDDLFERSDFYRHHYIETQLVDELCYCLVDEHGGYLLLSFARSSRSGRYQPEELRLAKVVAPVVLSSIAASWKAVADPRTLDPPSLDEIELHRGLRSARNNFGRSLLTSREFEVVQMMLRGYSVSLIAKRLAMAEGTTKVHRRNIYRKLDIGSQAELLSLFIDVVGEVKVESSEDPLIEYGRMSVGSSDYVPIEPR